MSTPILNDDAVMNSLIGLLKYAAGIIGLLISLMWAQINRKIDSCQTRADKSSEAIALSIEAIEVKHQESITELTEKLTDKVTDLDRRQIHSEIYIGDMKRRFRDIAHEATGEHSPMGDIL